jgi:agmatinase
MTGSESAMKDEGARISLFGWPGRQPALPDAGALCVVGAPTDHGNVISRGAAHGPAAIRHASLSLAAPALEGVDIGDVDRSDAPDPEVLMDRIAAAAHGICERGLCPLILGGDHSITYAPVSMLQRSRDLCLIWFDAHTDFSPWSGTPFHNHKQVLRRISKLPGVSRIVQIGYRGITGGDERSLGAKSAVVTTACARDLDEQALLQLVPENLPCYISIDIDIVDPFCAPGTSAPVPDGLLPHQVKSMLQTLVRHREILGADLVEVNPVLDRQSATSLAAAGLIHAIAEEWSHQRALREAGKAGAARRPARPGDRTAEARAAAPAQCGGN